MKTKCNWHKVRKRTCRWSRKQLLVKHVRCTDVIIYRSVWGKLSVPFHREVKGHGRQWRNTLWAAGEAELHWRTLSSKHQHVQAELNLKDGMSSMWVYWLHSQRWQQRWLSAVTGSFNSVWLFFFYTMEESLCFFECEVMKRMEGEFREKQFKQTIKSSQWCKTLARASCSCDTSDTTHPDSLCACSCSWCLNLDEFISCFWWTVFEGEVFPNQS